MKIDRSDLMLFIGIACIVFGIAQIYSPAAWIAAGIFIIAYSYLIAKERANAYSAKPDQE